MAQHYSDPTRETDPHALPNVETFYWSDADAKAFYRNASHFGGSDDDEEAAGWTAGWYYWFCFPGCLPDSDPVGPFATEDEALEDARQYSEDDAEDDDAIAEHCRQFAAHVDPDDDDAI